MKFGNATVEEVDGDLVVTGDDFLADFVDAKMDEFSDTEDGDPVKRVIALLESMSDADDVDDLDAGE
jgi:hypothetical protein